LSPVARRTTSVNCGLGAPITPATPTTSAVAVWAGAGVVSVGEFPQ
jgi:hypothetical protein